MFNGLVFLSLSARISDLAGRMGRVEDRLDNVLGALNELEKRLTKVEIKLGIQP